MAELSYRPVGTQDAREPPPRDPRWRIHFRLRRLSSPGVLLSICVATVAALTITRCIFAEAVDLRVDEAYYWTWSKENVISYLDHPPLIAWLIRLSTSVFGDTNFGVRFPGLLSISLMQLLLAGIVWRLLRDVRCVWRLS